MVSEQTAVRSRPRSDPKIGTAGRQNDGRLVNLRISVWRVEGCTSLAAVANADGIIVDDELGRGRRRRHLRLCRRQFLFGWTSGSSALRQGVRNERRAQPRCSPERCLASNYRTTSEAAGGVAMRRILIVLLVTLSETAPIVLAHPQLASAASHTIAINGAPNCGTSMFCYSPSSLTVTAGDTVTWVNNSTAPHTVTRCDPSTCPGRGRGRRRPERTVITDNQCERRHLHLHLHQTRQVQVLQRHTRPRHVARENYGRRSYDHDHDHDHDQYDIDNRPLHLDDDRRDPCRSDSSDDGSVYVHGCHQWHTQLWDLDVLLRPVIARSKRG